MVSSRGYGTGSATKGFGTTPASDAATFAARSTTIGWLALERNPGLEMGLELGEMLMLHLIIPPLLPARFNKLSNGVHLCLHF